MQQQINDIESDVKEIKALLIGNEYNDNSLIKRVKEVEDYQKKDRKQKYMFAGGAAVLGFLFNLWQRL